ncbi:MAG: hypothetical protein FD127_1084 [Acidimicrobiaceae bacterium]|nr:MAG: hypothetical protein FD127_1084 [Acidimicrobiaceae bacterium]
MALGHHRDPSFGRRLIEGDRHHPALRRVERCEPDETIGPEVEARLRLYAFHDGCPCLGAHLQQVRIDATPAHLHLDEKVRTVGRNLHLGPGLGRGQTVEHHRVAGRIGAEQVEADVAVVLIAGRIARVPEAGRVGQPGHR